MTTKTLNRRNSKKNRGGGLLDILGITKPKAEVNAPARAPEPELSTPETVPTTPETVPTTPEPELSTPETVPTTPETVPSTPELKKPPTFFKPVVEKIQFGGKNKSKKNNNSKKSKKNNKTKKSKKSTKK
jgi:hypothetical protein